MPAGLSVWDKTAQLQVDISARLTRILGTVDTGTGNGSHIDGRLTSGQGFFSIAEPVGANTLLTPTVTITGSTLSWVFTPGYEDNYIITYGVIS